MANNHTPTISQLHSTHSYPGTGICKLSQTTKALHHYYYPAVHRAKPQPTNILNLEQNKTLFSSVLVSLNKIPKFAYLTNETCQALFIRSVMAMSKAQRKVLAVRRVFGVAADLCPCCRQGKMIIVDVIFSNKDPPIGSPQSIANFYVNI